MFLKASDLRKYSLKTTNPTCFELLKSNAWNGQVSPPHTLGIGHKKS
jgi:hypothetical protein